MKGIIFNEFLGFIETTYSYDLVDRIINLSKVKSHGAYTSIGTYSPDELLKLIEVLSQEIDMSKEEILKSYGEYLFGAFVKKYPMFFKQKTSVFQFLAQVENHIHIEVRKLYEKTELPRFECSYINPNQFEMIYSSQRPLADLAEGLIQGCIHFHRESIELKRENLPSSSGVKVKFVLIKG